MNNEQINSKDEENKKDQIDIVTLIRDALIKEQSWRIMTCTSQREYKSKRIFNIRSESSIFYLGSSMIVNFGASKTAQMMIKTSGCVLLK